MALDNMKPLALRKLRQILLTSKDEKLVARVAEFVIEPKNQVGGLVPGVVIQNAQIAMIGQVLKEIQS